MVMYISKNRVRSTLVFSLYALVFATLGFLLVFSFTQSSLIHAADANKWKSGQIIDDSVFYNSNDLSTEQVQQFLDKMINSAGGCDTNGTKPSELGGGTRAQYGASRGYPAPYTCINKYYESPSTKANNLSGNPIPNDGISAAQIIKNAASTYGVSVRALLVIIQKESAGPLLTDTWPFPYQFNNAMGYGCPDTAPCDPQYYGFANQISNAARQFKLYKENPNSYRKKAQQSNDVLFNPSSTCGSSPVFITNNATAGLYNYTPYQPNQAALNNLYGTGDGCSAYGNRNFWRMFTDWFGSTTGPENYWSINAVNVFANSSHTQQVRSNGSELFLSPEQKIYVQVAVRNEGRTTWTKGQTRLGTYSPIDYASSFADSSWLAPFRITNFNEETVAPTQTATFDFTLTAPSNYGFYTERYNLVTEGVTWFNDANLRLYITVQKPDSTPASSQTILDSTTNSIGSGTAILSSDKHSVLKLQSDGSLDLFTNFTRTWSSKSNNTAANKLILQGDGNLVLYTTSNSPVWSSNTYGSNANKLVLQSDGNLVLYTPSNSPVWSSNTAIQDQTGLVSRVLPDSLTMYPGQSLTTPDRRYSLNYQGDGNIVLYNASNSPIWSTNTYLSTLGSLGLQSDGNLVLKNKEGSVIWSSGTGNRGRSNLLLQQDGNLVLYSNSGPATWASNTSGR